MPKSSAIAGQCRDILLPVEFIAHRRSDSSGVPGLKCPQDAARFCVVGGDTAGLAPLKDEAARRAEYAAATDSRGRGKLNLPHHFVGAASDSGQHSVAEFVESRNVSAAQEKMGIRPSPAPAETRRSLHVKIAGLRIEDMGSTRTPMPGASIVRGSIVGGVNAEQLSTKPAGILSFHWAQFAFAPPTRILSAPTDTAASARSWKAVTEFQAAPVWESAACPFRGRAKTYSHRAS